MSSATVAIPLKSMPPPPTPVGAPNKNLQNVSRLPPPNTQSSAPAPTQSAAGTSQAFHRPYQFRPRFPPNKGQDDASGIMYDGKRMRKAIHRKTVDYNPSVFKYLQNRVWQRDRRDEHLIQPDALYAVDLVPPSALLEHPMNCVTTRFVRTSTNKFRCPIFCLTWTPEGRRLVTGASSGEFTLWNGLTFNFETILQAHDTAVRAMRWSHSDSWMVTADHAGYIKYWQSNMNNVKMYQAHKEPIRGISFCPTDSKFASCSDDGTVRIWDFMRCHEERILRGHGADVRCVDWHPHKGLVASGSKDNQQPIKLWDPKTGNSLATLHAHKHTVMDLKWHMNGNWMLTASRDHLLKLFDIRNLKEELQTFKGHKREATAIGWHPIHEGLFVSGSADGALMFWNVGCDHEVGGMEEAHEGMVWSVAWHPLGHILASGSNDHATKFWTRNRPGDEMRDKYNLNTLPMGMMEQEMLEYSQESAAPNLPGMGLEHVLPEHLQVKEEKTENELPSIPGLDWEEDSLLLKAEERASQKKVPYARPVPKMFEQAWSGEIDVDQIKKEQQLQQLKAQFMPPTQPGLLLAQQVIGAIAGTLRQQLAASEGARMLMPGGSLMLGAPRMIIAPGQPVMGPGAGQMLLIPGSGSRPVAPGSTQANNGKPPELQNTQQILATTLNILNNAANSLTSAPPGTTQVNSFNQGVPQGSLQVLMGPQGPGSQQAHSEGLQNNLRQPGPPQFSVPQGNFRPTLNLQANMNVQEMDKDERFQGPPAQQSKEHNPQEMDQDYRQQHVYNGPVDNTEDEDYRVKGAKPMRDNRNMNDSRSGRHNFGDFPHEAGYIDAEAGNFDQRAPRNMHQAHQAHERNWDNYEETSEYPEEGWDGGDNGGYEENYDANYEEEYIEQDYPVENRNRKRQWEEGPGFSRGMPPRGRGGPWGRGDMRGRGRGVNFRHNRGMRPGGFRGGRGWNRGSDRGRGHRGY